MLTCSRIATPLFHSLASFAIKLLMRCEYLRLSRLFRMTSNMQRLPARNTPHSHKARTFPSRTSRKSGAQIPRLLTIAHCIFATIGKALHRDSSFCRRLFRYSALEISNDNAHRRFLAAPELHRDALCYSTAAQDERQIQPSPIQVFGTFLSLPRSNAFRQQHRQLTRRAVQFVPSEHQPAHQSSATRTTIAVPRLAKRDFAQRARRASTEHELQWTRV